MTYEESTAEQHIRCARVRADVGSCARAYLYLIAYREKKVEVDFSFVALCEFVKILLDILACLTDQFPYIREVFSSRVFPFFIVCAPSLRFMYLVMRLPDQTKRWHDAIVIVIVGLASRVMSALPGRAHRVSMI